MLPGYRNFLAIYHFITYVVISTFRISFSLTKFYSCFLTPQQTLLNKTRDLWEELDTIKLLKPHPYVIKLLECVTESGMLWLCGSNFAVHIFLMIYSVTLSCH